MIKTFVIDVDDTLCQAEYLKDGSRDYLNAKPIQPVISKINQLFQQGHQIILYTARGMRTYAGDLQAIEKNHRPLLEKWLKDHQVLYHQLIFGKPWWKDYYFVDDRCITVNQFLTFDPQNLDSVIQYNHPYLI